MSEPLPVLEYERVNWEDAPSRVTPLSADNLNNMDNAIAALSDYIYRLEDRVVELEGGSSIGPSIIADLIPTETHESSLGIYISDHDYSADDFMIIGDKIYKALSAIAIGGTILTPDSGGSPNVNEVSLGEAIVELAAKGCDISVLVPRINALETSVSNIIDVEIPYLHTRIDGIDPHPSHIGQIIQSTTLDTMAKVINVYGGTTWIQHDGYFLRGASSGVAPNSATGDGGEATHTLTVDEMPSHTHAQEQHRHNLGERSVYVGNGSAVAVVSYGGGSDNNALTGYSTASNQNTGGNQAHNNLPPYKNVYIWERTA